MVAFPHLLCHTLVALARGVTMYFKRIEDLRIDNDMTQQQIADFLECKREVYRRYEKGHREIPIWALIKLAKLYDCSIDYLLGISNTKRPFGN